jgi:hypothetical protein
MAFRATCCGLILSLMTRLLCLTGDAPLIGLQWEQSGQQANRPVLDLRRQHLKVRAGRRRMKQRQLRNAYAAAGP